MTLKVKRRELKYFINPADYTKILKALGSIMIPDSYNGENGYLVRSVYFDTPFNDSFEEKLDGVEKRRKYRLRIYGFEDKDVKFEIKNKVNNSILKETAIISKKDALRVLEGEYDVLLSYGNEILNKIYCEFSKMKYAPVVLVDYKREAFTWPMNNIRITFDTVLRSSISNFDLFDSQVFATTVQREGDIILEVKFDDELPSWMTHIFESVSFTNSAISKYCLSRMEA